MNHDKEAEKEVNAMFMVLLRVGVLALLIGLCLGLLIGMLIFKK